MGRLSARPQPSGERVLVPARRLWVSCGGVARIHYENRCTLVMLSGPVRLRLKVRRCDREGCARHRVPCRPEAEGALALPQHEFGLDVVALVGTLRHRDHRSVPEIHTLLRGRGVEIAERSVTNAWVHAAARLLGNDKGEDAARVQRRFDVLVAAMRRHRGHAGRLTSAIEHFAKVTRSYRPGLFHCYAVPGLARTNNDLEQMFGSQRYHERCASGRKAASPAAVLRGKVRLIAATTTRLRPLTARELGRVSREQWSRLRQRLDQRRHARTLRTRFRRDPDAYLAELELKACQPTLPA